MTSRDQTVDPHLLDPDPDPDPAAAPAAGSGSAEDGDGPPREPGAGQVPASGMVPARERRRSGLERGAMRIVATLGVIAIATALGAILASQDVEGWIVGLAVGTTSVVLAAILWSSRQL
ncbi:hypothetical protein [Patulibacter defluvii]|uniref:hypothetical protein n=1 Tax=Patulibacter defluvii TaxID=3095358 RepID=UPI002A761AB4|nr:hypothetical protein [Patulibacter sp. DM4]